MNARTLLGSAMAAATAGALVGGALLPFSASAQVASSTEPVITSISATPSNDGLGASIVWTTDVPSTSQVEYGTSTSYGTFSALSDVDSPVTSHLMTLSSLQPSTLYHFAVLSSATSTGTSTSNTSADQTFTTGNGAATTSFNGAPQYCNTSSDTMGYFVTTDMPSYREGQPINICLVDNTRTPLFLDGTHPWEIAQNGNVVFTPNQGTLTGTTTGTSFFTDSWNGMNGNGTNMSPGTYSVVFPGFPGSPSATFTITGTSTSSGSTSTSTTSTSTTPSSGSGGSVLNELVAQLQILQGDFPTYFGEIQGLINELLGNGTTVGNTAGATIDQNGQTFNAGGSIDFGGRNFGHEESVNVTLNGTIVAVAHADGGGNFSTGSLSLPSTPGKYTYIFTGQNSGISVPATITLK